jgi:hypothetical protein
LAARIDKVIAKVDMDAVRRRKDRIAEREVFIGDVDNGLAEISATMFATDAFAVSDGDKTAMMSRRQRTRTQQRAAADHR